ncbi:hypothetical protein A3F66_05350 [candidate division TM6 bacterium RIFCSPHIGHO2_12_FULL_32_22]|nr:MAG: hypothetical protein A3F66_05350 [candidate division TM6 bacterium RIFCSPHIGHO2_12_FULL_32_22]
MIFSVSKLSLNKLLLRFFFLFQITIFSYNFFWGKDGIFLLNLFKQENMLLSKKIDSVNSEVANLNIDIEAWKTDPFLKEKMARENLQMAKSSDEIYILV